MIIVGSGLIARSLQPYGSGHDESLAFASGVSDSTAVDQAAFERETAMLGNAIEKARSGGSRLVYFSGGGAIHGTWSHPVTESGPLGPATPYGRHQLACEGLIEASGLRYLIIRLPNVVGDRGNAKQLVPNLILQALSGRVSVQRRAARDLVGVDDMAAVVSELLDLVPDRATVNLATGHSVPVPVIAREICSILRASPSFDLSDTGQAQRFDTSHLKMLLGRDPFPDPDYYQGILRRHVPRLAMELAGARL